MKRQTERQAKRLDEKNKGITITKAVYNEKKKRFDMPNKKSNNQNAEEELLERQESVEECTKVYRELLPVMLNKLSKIKDPRRPDKVKHKITVLMVYGMLSFVFQFASRREVNRELTEPIFYENLISMFPELKSMPHADTLNRVLERIEVNQIQESLHDLFEELIRKKKFRRYLYQNKYLLALDGSQKFCRDEKWAEECLSRTVGKGETEHEQYYVYVLECVFIMDNGVTLPLFSEFLDNKNHKSNENKQDSERKAFYRLAKKIKARFPRLKIAVTIDGICCCGPVIRLCREFGWDYMITFKEGSMPDVWKESMALIKLESENRLECSWGERQQYYSWINDIEHYFGDNGRLIETVNVVVCLEIWEEVCRFTKKVKTLSTRYVWISSKTLNSKNIFDRCTKMGRARWSIENNFLILKHYGYNYEHCYSYSWNSMLGYHYLMNIGRFMNVIATNSECIFIKVKEKGITGFLKFVKKAVSGNLLEHERIAAIVSKKHYMKLYAA